MSSDISVCDKCMTQITEKNRGYTIPDSKGATIYLRCSDCSTCQKCGTRDSPHYCDVCRQACCQNCIEDHYVYCTRCRRGHVPCRGDFCNRRVGTFTQVQAAISPSMFKGLR